MKVDAHSTYPRDYITDCVRHLFTHDADIQEGSVPLRREM